MPRAKPIQVYRLWCGRKRYTGWLFDLADIWEIALDRGLAYGERGSAGLGPLTWIEYGTREHRRSRTIVEPGQGPKFPPT